MDEKSPYDLLAIFSLKCSAKEPSFCLKCESCILIDKINCTKTWFTSLGYTHQKLFLEELITLTPEVLSKLPTILYGLHSKDYQYTKSRLKPSVTEDAFQSNTNHSLDISKIDSIMSECILWFKSSTGWSRSNYVLVLLQLCGTPLLDAIKEFVLNHSKISLDTSLRHLENDLDDFSSLRISRGTSKGRIPKCKSAPSTRCSNDSKTHCSRTNTRSARERVVFDDKISVFDDLTDVDVKENCASDRLPSRSSMRSSSSRYQFSVKSNSSARCTPLNFVDSLTDVGDNLVYDELNFSYNVDGKDFIKCLPVHIAKKILSYLVERDLHIVSRVSVLWNDLAKQVRSDEKYILSRKEDVMMMQSSTVKTPNPCYARRVPVSIPKLDAKGHVQANTEGKHIDVQIITDEFSDINMEHCYDGLETERVYMEERNVYCGSYNVLKVDSRHDPNRHIHYDGGDLVSVGSPDRKIFLLNVITGDKVRKIYGHGGSVKCLHLNENNNTVVSSGYDTTIRLWNLKNGKCNIIFLGHQGTVVCLDVSTKYLVSSSRDSVMKIWNLLTGKCLVTVNHNCVVKVLQIIGDIIVTGTSNGEVLAWDIKTGHTIKAFSGHGKSVTCIKATPYFIFSGSSDSCVKLWNNVGDFYSCLKTYRHPEEVLCLDISFCRLITGCFDGKIRVWNILNASCLRVIRGNSKNDPISYLFASENRLVVNTISAILIYNFEEDKWDYHAPREKGEMISKTRHPYSFDNTHPYSYTRAQKSIYHGSPLHKVIPSKEDLDDKDEIYESGKNKLRSRNNRVRSAPIARYPIDQSRQLCPQKMMNRCKSAFEVSRNVNNFDQHVSRIKSGNKTCILLKGEKDTILAKIDSSDQRLKSTVVRTRCRSAPIQRVMQFSKNGKGVSTSSFTYTETNNRTSPWPAHKDAKIQRPRTAVSQNISSLNKFRLRTYYSQLNYEETLQNS